ncbi:MAG: transglycosylase SLT domain-containing protein [Spirochaetales bacterium]|nr:transglycosylase SLT domain-containing protein [Spirochaetales bacterium]
MLISIIIVSSYIPFEGKTSFSQGGQPQKNLADRKVLGTYLTAIVEEDLSLTLYRNEVTQKILISYYTKITRSELITRTILKYADMYNISPALAFALCSRESGFDINAQNINKDESIDRGLFQLNSKSFPELSEDDFFSVETNTLFGLKYLKYCLEQGNNEIVALSMYNAGEGRISSKGAPLLTLNYVARVLDYKERIETGLRDLVKEVLYS